MAMRPGPPRPEKLAQQCGGRLRQDTRFDLEPVIEAGVLHDVAERPAHTGLRVGCRVHQSVNLCQDERARAHRAWLERNIERCIEEARFGSVARTTANALGGAAQYERFRMRCRIIGGACAVVCFGDQHTVADENCAYGDFVDCTRSIRLFDRALHPEQIFQLRHSLRSQESVPSQRVHAGDVRR